MTRKARLARGTAMEIRRFLTAKQAELKESMWSAVTERCATKGSRPADSAVWAAETLEDEIQVALIERQRRHLAQVEAALERLDQRGYGFCEDCAKFIGLPRLRALPFAKQCRECQSRAELYARPEMGWHPALKGEAKIAERRGAIRTISDRIFDSREMAKILRVSILGARCYGPDSSC